MQTKTVWPSGLRRWLKAPVRKGVGSNPTAVIGVLAPKGEGSATLNLPKRQASALGRQRGSAVTVHFLRSGPVEAVKR